MSESDLGGLQNLFGNFIGPLIDLIFWNDPHPQAMKDRSSKPLARRADPTYPIVADDPSPLP